MDGKPDAEVGNAIFGGMMVEICTKMKTSRETNPSGEDCAKAQAMVRVMARSGM